MPSGSLAVFALNCLQKSMMFKPCGPSAVPTGGAGVALPAGNCNLIVVCTFLAMSLPQVNLLFSVARLAQFLDAGKIQFHRRRTPENRYRNVQPVSNAEKSLPKPSAGYVVRHFLPPCR